MTPSNILGVGYQDYFILNTFNLLRSYVQTGLSNTQATQDQLNNYITFNTVATTL